MTQQRGGIQGRDQYLIKTHNWERILKDCNAEAVN